MTPHYPLADAVPRLAPRNGVLRSTYRRESDDKLGRFEIHVELTNGRFEAGDRLGMCAGTAFRPTADSAAVRVEALSTRLVLRPDPPDLIEGGNQWTISGLRPQQPAIHANDGPVSAWIERADGTTPSSRVDRKSVV